MESARLKLNEMPTTMGTQLRQVYGDNCLSKSFLEFMNRNKGDFRTQITPLYGRHSYDTEQQYVLIAAVMKMQGCISTIYDVISAEPQSNL